MGPAKATKTALTATVSSKVTNRAMRTSRLALSRSPAPLRRATMADTATFMERKTARPKNLGWVESPTAAMANEPREPTMIVSTRPARHTKKDSNTEGQATFKASRTMRPLGGTSPISIPLQTFWGFTNCTASHSFTQIVDSAIIIALLAEKSKPAKPPAKKKPGVSVSESFLCSPTGGGIQRIISVVGTPSRNPPAWQKP